MLNYLIAMTFTLKNIKSRFLLQIGLFIIFFALLSLIAYIAFQKINKDKQFEVELINLRKNIENSYTAYCNFLFETNTDEGFISEGKNPYTKEFSQLLDNTRVSVQNLDNRWRFYSFSNRKALLDTFLISLNNYQENFNYLALSFNERGNAELGNLKSFNELSDNLALKITSFNNTELSQFALELKDLETEFIYLGKSNALDQIMRTLDKIFISLGTLDKYSVELEETKGILEDYSLKINYLNKILTRIGSNKTQNGLQSEFINSYHTVLLSFSNYKIVALEQINNVDAYWKIGALVIMLIISITYIFYIWHFLVSVKTSFQQTIDFSHQLSKGKLLAHELPLKKISEFSSINYNLNRINNSVKEKKIFIDNLLKQRFDIDLSLQGKNDTFSKTLLALKENMRKAREEQLKHAEENKLRRYLNEGVANFADILRLNSDNLNKLSDIFIRELVKYLEALQGGLFLMSEDNKELKLAASFAYNRKKYLNKTIAPGEGLVGACALEMKSINLSEIPEEYIEITSGLGDAPPTNLLLLPVMHEGTLIGVVELASIKKFEAHQIQVGENIASSLASTIINTQINARTSELLQKSQQQAVEMAEQEEEMRQNMEELKATQEESSRREEELKGVLTALDSAFYMLEYDIEGVICKANQKLLSLIYMPSDKVLGKTHLELFGKGSKADTSFFAKVSDGNVIELIEKVKIQNKPLELHNTFVPIQSKEGKTLSILNIFSVIF